MKDAIHIHFWFISMLLIVSGCSGTPDDIPVGPDGWLKGTSHEKFEVIAGQLRGFDMAMVETGYRYKELYWAGVNKNWDYAAYQIEKIQVALENGFERRPARAASAEDFMDITLPDIQNSVIQQDSIAFMNSFRLMTMQCNACHVAEDVAWFRIEKPTINTSIIGTP